MHSIKDEYSQREINAIVRRIENIINESTNKQETKERLIKELKKVLPIEESLDDGTYWR